MAYKRIVVATDGSATAETAERVAVTLASGMIVAGAVLVRLTAPLGRQVRTRQPVPTQPAATQPAVIDQEDCRYVPHVLAIPAGQMVTFTSSEPASVAHNVHIASLGLNQSITGPGALREFGGKSVYMTQ